MAGTVWPPCMGSFTPVAGSLSAFRGRTSPKRAWVQKTLLPRTASTSGRAGLSVESQIESYIYGNDVRWDGTNYTLLDTYSSDNWSEDRYILATKYNYTCFNSNGICTNVYYVTDFHKDTFAYYLSLSNGKILDDVKNESFTNTTDSNVKKIVDNWYKNDMTTYTNKLEDIVWCNDRTLVDGPLKSKDISADIDRRSNYYISYKRWLEYSPSLMCSSIRDSFTVNSNIGNGMLTYPVGLLTSDEVMMAGIIDSYLTTGEYQWLLSPSDIDDDSSGLFFIRPNGELAENYTGGDRSIRPSISLKVGTLITSGDGTAASPYIVE